MNHRRRIPWLSILTGAGLGLSLGACELGSFDVGGSFCFSPTFFEVSYELLATEQGCDCVETDVCLMPATSGSFSGDGVPNCVWHRESERVVAVNGRWFNTSSGERLLADTFASCDEDDSPALCDCCSDGPPACAGF